MEVQPEREAAPKPPCACGHPYKAHSIGRCHASVPLTAHDGIGSCPCRRYSVKPLELEALERVGAAKSGRAEELRQHPERGVPEWRRLAQAEDWLGAAKAAVLDQGAPSAAVLALGTIALAEQMSLAYLQREDANG